MKPYQIAHIEYTRSTDLGGGNKGDVTDRHIIPTFIPKDFIKAIDVTELDDDERDNIQQLWEGYQEYYQNAVQTLFDFDQWVEHTTSQEPVELKWRTFKLANIKELE